jgi:outer membrane protein
MKSRFAIAAAYAISALVAPSAHAQGREGASAVPATRAMSLDDCIAFAATHSPDALSGDLEIDGARASQAGVRGELGPKVRLEGNVLRWNSAFELPFALPGASGPPPVLTVRDNFTWTASASVIQPVSALFLIYDQFKVQALGIDVTSIRRDVAKRDVAFRVAESYMRLLEASRLVEVGTTSVTQIEAQQRQARSLLANGIIGKNDALRADLALAGARQRLIQGKGQVVLARGRLASALGMPPGVEIDAVPIAGELPPNDEPSVASAEAHAVANRLELREISRRIEQEKLRVGVAKLRRLPQVNLVGNYTHAEGSAFAQKNSAYVGGALTWDVWDWGTTSAGVREADVKRQQAELAQRKLGDEVRLEARQAFVEAAAAREALDVARVAVTLAEENFRIVTKRFEANTGTSFELVDAESLLTQARAQVETSLYAYLIARLSLQRATGAAGPRVRG